MECPDGVTTPNPGSTSIANCTVCEPDFCNNHGRCVLSNGKPQCNCDFSYSLSQRCSQPLALYIVLAVLCSVAFALATVATYRNYRKVNLRVGHYQHTSDLHERLLNETRMELTDIRQVS